MSVFFGETHDLGFESETLSETLDDQLSCRNATINIDFAAENKM